jgi:hypothetical protein
MNARLLAVGAESTSYLKLRILLLQKMYGIVIELSVSL